MSTTLTVRELCDAVGAAVESTFPDEVWVKGAISGLSRAQNGHAYFDLVDPVDDLGSTSREVLPVALFASNRQRVNHILKKSGGVRMHDGVEIRIRGQVRYYPPQGRVQLLMSLIDPAYTVGRMALARAALLEALRAEGLLHANGLRELPVLPLRVGLITSDHSAAHADFVHELDLSGYRFEVTLFDSRVQGLDAVPSLCEAIDAVGRADVDVVALVRGGGARTDLAAFDHERVARAIAGCRLPVVVGVGHEVDRSVADEVAHTSAKTPTATAGVLVDAVRAFESRVESAASRLVTRSEADLDRARTALTGSGRRLIQASERALERSGAALGVAADRLGGTGRRALQRAEVDLDRADQQLRALDPATLLDRGWSITHTADGALVRETSTLATGETLVTRLASGTVTSTVIATSTPPSRPDLPAGDDQPEPR